MTQNMRSTNMDVANVHHDWIETTSGKRQNFKTIIKVKYLWKLVILRVCSRPSPHALDLLVETLS
jgi:hypothetical protein